jgi:hypothetical protein
MEDETGPALAWRTILRGLGRKSENKISTSFGTVCITARKPDVEAVGRSAGRQLAFGSVARKFRANPSALSVGHRRGQALRFSGESARRAGVELYGPYREGFARRSEPILRSPRSAWRRLRRAPQSAVIVLPKRTRLASGQITAGAAPYAAKNVYPPHTSFFRNPISRLTGARMPLGPDQSRLVRWWRRTSRTEPRQVPTGHGRNGSPSPTADR